MTKNQDVRQKINDAGVKLWQVADKLNIHDSNFSRLLRKELSPQKKKEIFKIVNELKKGIKKDGE